MHRTEILFVEERRQAKEQSPGEAVLDIDVCGTAIYPVARFLKRHKVPFLFVSGSDPKTIEEGFRSVPRLMKPIGEYQLQRAALQLFRTSSPHQH